MQHKAKTPLEQKRELKKRVAGIKTKLPKDWRKRLVKKYPMYDHLEFAELLNRVHALRVADVSVTNILEEISKEYQLELKQ